MTNKIEKLIVRYLTNSATMSDLDILSDWISKPANERMFKDYVQTYYAIISGMNNDDSQKTAEQLLHVIRKEKSFIHQLKTNVVYKYAVAASVILIVSLSIFLNKERNSIKSVEPPIIVSNQIETGTDKATLTLETGEEVTLLKGTSFQTQNLTSNGEEVIYNKTGTKEIAYNYLTIPRGGQFQIVLADGTKVWLNSESQLKYPVSFKEGETRQVELVYGEAYFDVSPSALHKGSKFKVFNQSQEIEVLGTEFNIKAYKDEINIYTTLVEGQVVVDFSGGKENLIPNQQSNLNVLSSSVTVTKVDVYNEISWKEGIFTFEGKPLKDIVKVLSRWYDVDFVFVDKSSEEKRFNGSLKRRLKINEILDAIKNFGKIKGYEINGKTIMIK